ncbi:MAG: triose-phosphate isomerase [Candidatus Paceibacterota bacterium]|jgi:triosephosphate isomerase
MKNRRLVVGNWKMNPTTEEEAKEIARKVRRTVSGLGSIETVLCPPYIFVSAVRPSVKVPHFHVGAQSVSFLEGGSHTGEVGAQMLKDSGVEYVIVGHSEMRAIGDTDEIVSKKIAAVLEADLSPIVCFGEKIRDESGSHFNFLKEQMKNTLVNIPKSKSSKIIIAYEPIWAIGAAEAMKPEEIYEMSIFIKKIFSDIFSINLAHKIDVLYGGAVTYKNAFDIVKTGQIDGLLVGRESVNVTGFVELLKVVDSVPV